MGRRVVEEIYLKEHGNEAGFLGFLQKLVLHRSLTLPFEPFRFWLRIRGDIISIAVFDVGVLFTSRKKLDRGGGCGDWIIVLRSIFT
jgi:hypothetical protein